MYACGAMAQANVAWLHHMCRCVSEMHASPCVLAWSSNFATSLIVCLAVFAVTTPLVDCLAVQAKLHLLCPSLFAFAHESTGCAPAMPSLTATISKSDGSATARAMATLAPTAQVGSSDAPAAIGTHPPPPVADLLAILPGHGGRFSMPNLGKLVLRPLKGRGLDCSEVATRVTLEDLVAQLQEDAPRALELATGAHSAAPQPLGSSACGCIRCAGILVPYVSCQQTVKPVAIKFLQEVKHGMVENLMIAMEIGTLERSCIA
jgi:hypothetical protein